LLDSTFSAAFLDGLLQLPRMVRFPARMVESLLLLAPLLDPWVRLRLPNPPPEHSTVFVDINKYLETRAAEGF
jgi:hypothetical protein